MALSKEEYVKSCLADAISALSVDNLPQSIQVGNDWIYPKVALERIKSVLRADEIFKDRT